MCLPGEKAYFERCGVALNPGRIRCELHWKLHLTLNIKTQRGVRGNFIFTLNFISLGLEFSFHFRCDFASTIIHRFGDSVWLGLLTARMKSEVVNLLSPSGDLGISLVWHNLSGPPHRDFSVWVLKSSSKWTKLSMRGPQLFSGWYQMILGVFRCS